MPSIVYDGVRYTQTKHSIQCKKCLDTIESKNRYDLKYCSCKAVGIDGGISSGNSILGNLSDVENRSMYCAIVNKKKIWLSGGFIPLTPYLARFSSHNPVENLIPENLIPQPVDNLIPQPVDNPIPHTR